MKKKCIKLIGLICFLCVLLSAVFTLFDIRVFERAKDNDFYFNIITLNSVIAGFAFTNIGLLLSAFSTEVVQRICKTDIMKRKNDKLLASVIYCVAAMFISLLYVVDLGPIVNKYIPELIVKTIADGLYLAIITSMILGIVYFVKSIADISNLLDEVYKNKSNLTTEKIENINKELRKEK